MVADSRTADDVPGESASLERDVAALEVLANRSVTSALDLVATLDAIHARVLAANLSRYDPAVTRADAPAAIKRLFQVRLALRRRIDAWHQAGLLTPAAEASLRNVFRVSRYAGDLLVEVASQAPRKNADDPHVRGFTDTHSGLLINPRFVEQGVTFEAGDVLLVRGALHNSAAIARIGDVDSQFSHLAIVYVDKAGRRFLVEALIEDGAVITPLDEALDHGLARAILFRQADRQVAERAARLIHKRVKHSRRWYGTKILYDFSMKLDSYQRLFCSNLVREAYDRASGGRMLLPTFPSSLKSASPDFLARIGVTTDTTFAPADMELERDFDIVAEWRDPRVTPTVRLHDLAMTKLFEWMEKDGWKFKETWTIRLISWGGRFASFLSDDAKALIADIVPKVPVNMRTRTIATIAMLHKTAEELYQHVRALDDAHLALHGHAMHPTEVLSVLEQYRRSAGDHIGYVVAPATRTPATA